MSGDPSDAPDSRSPADAVPGTDDPLTRLLTGEADYEDVVTGVEPLPVSFEKAVELHEDRRAQLYKGGVHDRSLVAAGAVDPAPRGEFAALSYGQTRDLVRKLATGFRALGVDDTDRVGILSAPRMEWTAADLALLAAGATVVPVDEDASDRHAQYVLGDAGATGVVVDADRLDRALAVSREVGLAFVVVVDDVDVSDRDGVFTLAEVYRQGADRYDLEAYRSWIDAVDGSDLASLAYVAGDSGRPRGVRLSHRNHRANVDQVYRRLAPRPDRPDGAATVEPVDVVLSHLPLSRPFERTVGQLLPLLVGATVAYAEGLDSLLADFGSVRPSVATGVPWTFERLYEQVRSRVADREVRGRQIGERLFDWAVETGREHRATTAPGLFLRLKRRVAESVVFRRVRAALGGRLDLLISGGQAVSPGVVGLYRGMGLPLVEGYGPAEATAVATLNPPEYPEVGSIGLPVEGLAISLDPAAVPEGGVSGADGELGELTVYGPNVTDGYWNRPDETRRATTTRGYVRTGDVVERRPDGYLVFRERARQIFVLSTGEHVAPSPIEQRLVDGRTVDQALVVGDGRQYPVALIVPDLERLRQAAAREGVSVPDDRGAMCEDPHVRAAVEREIRRVNEEFESHERVRAFRLLPEPWTEADGALTATGRKNRGVIEDRHDDLIAAMYDPDEPRVGDGDGKSRSPEPAD